MKFNYLALLFWILLFPIILASVLYKDFMAYIVILTILFLIVYVFLLSVFEIDFLGLTRFFPSDCEEDASRDLGEST